MIFWCQAVLWCFWWCWRRRGEESTSAYLVSENRETNRGLREWGKRDQWQREREIWWERSRAGRNTEHTKHLKVTKLKKKNWHLIPKSAERLIGHLCPFAAVGHILTEIGMQCVCTHVYMTVHHLILFFSFLFSLNLSICLSNYVTALSQNSPHCQKYWIEICSKHKHEIPSLNFGIFNSTQVL